MSTFADTEFDALEMTAEMIRGYIESMEGSGLKIPLPQAKLVELKRIVGLMTYPLAARHSAQGQIFLK